MKVVFETHRRLIELLGEQAVHFAAAAEATRGAGSRDLPGFIRAYDAARAVQVKLNEEMEQLDMNWEQQGGCPDVRKVARCLMDEMVDWVINLYHELDIVHDYDLAVSSDFAIERGGTSDVDAGADALLLLGNATAMYAWCWIDHLLLRTESASDREARFMQFAWNDKEFGEAYGAIQLEVARGEIGSQSVVAATAEYLVKGVEAMRNDVINMSEQPAGAGA